MPGSTVRRIALAAIVVLVGYSGYQSAPRSNAFMPPYVAAAGVQTSTPVAKGGFHTLAIDSSGALWSWGFNFNGQLGTGNSTSSSTPVRVVTTGMALPVVAIAAGTVHSLAVDSAGAVWAWGANVTGELGNGSTQLSAVPIPVSMPSGMTRPVRAVAAGRDYSLAIDADGHVWSWGYNVAGQLGVGNNTNSSLPVQIPLAVGMTPPIRMIAAGDGTAFSIDAAGKVWSWGSNYAGDLGVGVTYASLSGSNVPLPVAPGFMTQPVKTIAAGLLHTFAIDANNQLAAWGSNYYGQLGIDSGPNQYCTTGTGNSDDQLSPFPVQIGPVASIAGGGSHSVAVDTTGKIWSWGSNFSGELGTGSTSCNGSNSPVQISMPGAMSLPIADVVAGDRQSFAVDAAGTLWAWGLNNGTLGNCDSAQTSSPVLVCNLPPLAGVQPPPPAQRPLIFIPGIAGSELSAVRDSPSGGRTFVDSNGNNKTEAYTSGEAIWLNGSKLEPLPQAFNDQEFLDLLRFDSSGNPLFGDFAPTGKFVTATVNPPIGGPQTVAPYGNVIPALSSAGYTLGVNLFVFAYDWRYNADHARGDLDAMVTQVLAQTGASSVDIIAHSMGTMVTRDYLLYGANRSKVHSVVLLAPPNLGTVKGTVAVHQGVCLPDYLTGIMQIGNCYISDRTVRYIYRTIPGGLDQTPSQAYYSVYNGQDAAHPVAFRDDTVNPAAVGWNALANYETAPGPSDVSCTLIFCQDEAAVTPAAFNASNAFHNLEDDWYNHISTPVAIMVGTGQCTIGQILKEPVVTPSRFGPVKSVRWDIRNIDGDGTVPRRSASLDDGRLAPNVALYYRNFDHSGMGSQTSVLSDAVSILHGSTPSSGTIGSPNPTTCHQIIVESPMQMLITDSQGRRMGSLDGSTEFREQPTNEFMRLDETKNATIYGTDTFRVDLQGTGDGEASIKMRVVGVDQTLKVVAFNHVPVTAKTKATFTFNTGSSTTSTLTLDPDGSGQHLQTIGPVVISSNTDDSVPPTINIVGPLPGQAVVGKFAVNWTATKAAGSPVTQTFAVIDAGGASPQRIDQPGFVTVTAGSHTLDIYAEDALGNSTVSHLDFVADSFDWKPPMSSDGITVHGNRTLPVKFSVTNSSGALVNDASCVVAVVDAGGTVVMSQACAVDGNSSSYHVNLETGSLVVGSYSIRVSFNSPTLTGSFAAPLVKS